MSGNKAKGQEQMNENGGYPNPMKLPDEAYPYRDENGEVWVKPDPETRCGNCRAELEPGDKYCRVCGTKRGEGAYDPYPEMLDYQDIYGPMPVERSHHCSKCGYSWRTCLMIDNQDYCPMCGNPASVFAFY